MKKRFFSLKKGEQFRRDGWDFMKIGMISAHSSHFSLPRIKLFILPFEFVDAISSNPNCESECPCKNI